MANNDGYKADDADTQNASRAPVPAPAQLETDDFGLPIRPYVAPTGDATLPKSDAGPNNETGDSQTTDELKDGKESDSHAPAPEPKDQKPYSTSASSRSRNREAASDSDSDDVSFVDAQSAIPANSHNASTSKPEALTPRAQTPVTATATEVDDEGHSPTSMPTASSEETIASISQTPRLQPGTTDSLANGTKTPVPDEKQTEAIGACSEEADKHPEVAHSCDVSAVSNNSGPQQGLSEFSHQQLSTQQKDEKKVDDDDGWQAMPSFAPYDIYDDDNRLIAREHNEDEDESYGYSGLGGAGKGYTRVIMDEDAESATSMDENTQYLFQEARKGTGVADDEARDAVAQMQATKDLLTEGQRIAYVGVVRLEIAKLVKEADGLEVTKKTKKLVNMSAESKKMWGQKMMIRIYSHMDISEAEQVMIEQLAEHGVIPKDLTPTLHANSRVQNPMAEERTSAEKSTSRSTSVSSGPPTPNDDKPAEMPPPYESIDHSEVPDAQTPSQLPTTEKIDIDLRWTVLCDLFLILIADSVYDARSRVLLERVADSLEIPWVDICKFEKRVTDALEMQQAAEKENWNEEEHMESRRKQAQSRRYMMMGLATVGGGLVIGLSAGLLAPVIGAGLAAGFTTIGVTGTSSFLAGAGGAAIITSSAAASGSLIGGRAANRRTGAVKTFEYRPLHNNKRVNLIVTVSGWLTGKVDDVRLPFSTVDSTMGDIYSVLWEPEMLRSMGDTINILATEALTQGLQQILGSTILMGLMAALQLPIVLTKLSYLIDNPWAVSLDRATAAGLILADSLMDRSLGTRPITLVGYSLGARVIFSCLQELAKRGAYGLVQNVYLFGSPVVVKKDEFLRARTIVSGRFLNGYNRNDWILGYLFRLTNGGIRKVAGLAPIDVPWVDNMDVTEEVPGHMQYRTAMPSLLIKCGWMVESEEFTEIEDPDPDNHEERQRELINEIEEARKELEREGKTKKSGRFSLFGRRKKADRQEWEVYEESAAKGTKAEENGGGKTEDKLGNNHGVLFDIDAIRAELAKESRGDPEAEMALQVKEIESTLPPMKLDFSPTTPSHSWPVVDGRSSLRETRSADVLPVGGMGFGSTNGSREMSPYHTDAQEEEEVQMTFDTSFDDYAHAQAHSASSANYESSGTRPGTKSSQTLPNMTISDPWADAEAEDFGKEEEISMTFA
ncbi:DUF726 domain protein [Metarhizium rileyi]|uniref:DUF726 domain protein n=1 Tax=Metarhizium rileyi (strain RCEF 4871) TaxID=1649241 RepID=A0A167DP71_METRR|nr:DUF726 domain protein [Metarhizium rileyi RCEF 4871]